MKQTWIEKEEKKFLRKYLKESKKLRDQLDKAYRKHVDEIIKQQIVHDNNPVP